MKDIKQAACNYLAFIMKSGDIKGKKRNIIIDAYVSGYNKAKKDIYEKSIKQTDIEGNR